MTAETRVGILGGMAAARGAGDAPDSLFFETLCIRYMGTQGGFLNALSYGERSRYLYTRMCCLGE